MCAVNVQEVHNQRDSGVWSNCSLTNQHSMATVEGPEESFIVKVNDIIYAGTKIFLTAYEIS